MPNRNNVANRTRVVGILRACGFKIQEDEEGKYGTFTFKEQVQDTNGQKVEKNTDIKVYADSLELKTKEDGTNYLKIEDERLGQDENGKPYFLMVGTDEVGNPYIRKEVEKTEDKTEDKPEEKEETDEFYDADAYRDFYTPNKKKPEKKPNKGVWKGEELNFKPEKFKPKDAKFFFEVAWNQLIEPFYMGIIDGSINFAINGLNWMLFRTYDSGAQITKPKADKKTVFDYRDDVYVQKRSQIDETVRFFNKTWEEFMSNIQKAKNNEPTTWNTTPDKKAPEFFEKAVEISKKADADPNSEEAKKWKNLENAREIMLGLRRKELTLRLISLTFAACDEAVYSEEYKVSKDLNEKIKEMEEVFNKNDSKELKEETKTKLKEKIAETKELLQKENNESLKKEMEKELKELSIALDTPSVSSKKIAEHISQLGQNNMQIKHIEKNSEEYYKKIYENISKIEELYKKEPEKMTEVITNYVESLKNASIEAEKAIKARLNRGVLKKGGEFIGEKITETINNIQNRYNADVDNSSPIEKVDGYQEILKNMKESIDNFKVRTNPADAQSYEMDDIGNLKLKKTTTSPFSTEDKKAFINRMMMMNIR